jgi:hypothetical protein
MGALSLAAVLSTMHAARARRRRVTSSGRGRGPCQRQLFEPGNEANNERGERGDNVGEQLLLSQPPPRRLLLLCVPDRTGLALFDLPDTQTFELTAPGAPLSPSCHLASHLLGLPVPQKLFSGQLAVVGRMMRNDARGIAQQRAPIRLHFASGERPSSPAGRRNRCDRINTDVVWPLELGDRGRAPPDGLADLEAFELRMVDVERLVLARIPVGGAEFG